jgi:uncharacterized protein YbcI
MTSQLATRGQTERTLSQRIQALYRTQLGHQPGKVTCQLFDEALAVVIEDSVTQPEKLLAAEGHVERAEQVRSDLDQAIRPHIKFLVEEVLSVNVLDILSDATLQTGRTGMIVILDNPPTVRPSASSLRPFKQRLGQRDVEEEQG